MKLIDADKIPYEEHYVPDPDSDIQWDYKLEFCVLKPVIDSMAEVDGVYLTREEYEELLEYKHMYEDLCK